MTMTIDYPQRMRKAMINMIVELLSDVAENGLPGDHHFYITFKTNSHGVDIPDFLRENYPESMTIVLQEWFDNLGVMDDRFCVTLNFSNTPYNLVIPFDALLGFADPSVEFGLRFEMETQDDDEDDIIEVDDAKDDSTPKEATVVSLDKFRKN